MSNFSVYLYAVFVQWGGIYTMVTLIPDASKWIQRDGVIARISRWLDKRITLTHRMRLYRSLFVVGIFFAGFLAWNEQYVAARDLRQVKPMAGIFSVPQGADSVTVPLPHRMKERYSLSVTANWSTNIIIEEKTADHFSVGFNAEAVGNDGRIEWQ